MTWLGSELHPSDASSVMVASLSSYKASAVNHGKEIQIPQVWQKAVPGTEQAEYLSQEKT